MALSDENKSKIVYHLGYPGKTLVETSLQYDSRIVDRLTNLDTFTESQAIALIGQIESIKTKLVASPESFKLKQVGDIVFNVDTGLVLQKKELRRYLKELSSLLDIPLVGNSSMISIGV